MIPYEGAAIGEFSRDTTINFKIGLTDNRGQYMALTEGMTERIGTLYSGATAYGGNPIGFDFEASRVMPTGPFVKPASVSAYPCVSY